MLPSPAQCRAARALLDWTQKDLADASKVGTKTIADYERGASTPFERTVRDLREAFEAAGIEFTNGAAPGLRLRPKRRGK
jgi:transcriptional regulator with XRE-family HTH domain